MLEVITTGLPAETLDKIRTMSQAEYAVFLAIADGVKTSVIANGPPKRSIKTVEAHINHIKTKLGLKHITEVRCIAAKFVAFYGKPKLSGRRINYVRDFITTQ
jgi:DNA-binding NarL/FixJ family response regulator